MDTSIFQGIKYFCYADTSDISFSWVLRYDFDKSKGVLRGIDSRFSNWNDEKDCGLNSLEVINRFKEGKWKIITKKHANEIIKKWWTLTESIK